MKAKDVFKIENQPTDDCARTQQSEEDSLHLLFNDIFVSYEKPLFKLAFNLTKDKDVARDIIHDVFMKLWEIRHQLHEIQSVESFLFILTRNKVMDYLRKVSSDARLKQAIWESMQDLLAEDPKGIEEKEFQTGLQQAIDQLPPQRKAIYQLRDEGYPYQEIADQLQISRHTVKNQISSAIKSIRQVMEKFLI